MYDKRCVLRGLSRELVFVFRRIGDTQVLTYTSTQSINILCSGLSETVVVYKFSRLISNIQNTKEHKETGDSKYLDQPRCLFGRFINE